MGYQGYAVEAPDAHDLVCQLDPEYPFKVTRLTVEHPSSPWRVTRLVHLNQYSRKRKRGNKKRGDRERVDNHGGRRDGPSTVGRGQPQTDPLQNTITATRSGVPDETFILYHLIWKNLLYGPASFSRRPIPIELVRMIVRYAGLIVLDRTSTTVTTTRIDLHSHGPLLHSVWFYTDTLDRPALMNTAQIQLLTVSCDQGWTSEANTASWTWFDVGVFPPPPADLLGDEATDDSGGHEPSRSLPSRKVQDYFAAHDAGLWKRSHSNPVARGVFETREGAVFDMDHDLWDLATEGHVIAVRACAQYPGWQNRAQEGILKVWKYFEPLPL